MAQGKVKRLGCKLSLRMEEKARRASTESPLRARSAMTEFQEETLVLSTYLSNMVVRLAFLVHVIVECRRFASAAADAKTRPVMIILGANKIGCGDIFIHSFVNAIWVL